MSFEEMGKLLDNAIKMFRVLLKNGFEEPDIVLTAPVFFGWTIHKASERGIPSNQVVQTIVASALSFSELFRIIGKAIELEAKGELKLFTDSPYSLHFLRVISISKMFGISINDVIEVMEKSRGTAETNAELMLSTAMQMLLARIAEEVKDRRVAKAIAETKPTVEENKVSFNISALDKLLSGSAFGLNKRKIVSEVEEEVSKRMQV